MKDGELSPLLRNLLPVTGLGDLITDAASPRTRGELNF